MSADGGIEVTRAGQRLKIKMLVALVLASVVPALVLAVVLLMVVLRPFLQILAGVTIIGLLTGAWVLWRIVVRIAGDDAMSSLAPQGEMDVLMTAYNKMLATIEQQATEINTFASRLDTAYRELESNNARLKEASFKDDRS